MKTNIIIIVACLSSILAGCSNKSQSSAKTLRFEDLPIDVRLKFKQVYNYCPPPTFNGSDTIEYTPPFIEAYNMNGDTAIIKMSKMMFSNSFTIYSNGKSIKLDLNILERVFIIKGDSIYYPISGNGITTSGEPRSSNVKVDTLMFQASIMIRRTK